MRKLGTEALSPGTWFGLNRPGTAEEENDVVLFGIPFDGGVSYRGGAAEAPARLRANTDHATPCTESLDYYKEFRVLDVGDFQAETREELFREVETYTESLVRRGIPFTMIGGDHSVTIPVQKGVDAALTEPFGIIHIDAHFDLCDALEGDPLSHGSTERRALDLKNVASTENLYFIGIRSIEEDEFAFSRTHKVQVRTARECFEQGIEAVAEDCIRAMGQFGKIYLTFDIDALDPAYAGGTGTPQAGGLTSRMALYLLRRIFTELPVIGFDIVEIAPALDDSLASMYTGRKLLTEAWGVWAEKAGKLEPFR